MSVIEVERKFELSPSARATLLALPGVTTAHSLNDRYYCEDLALTDHWLRKRNGDWELKLPVANKQHLRAAVYRELAGSAVWAALSRQPPSAAECFAALHTERTELSLPWREFDVTVTLDDCTSPDGFRCSVGELEILVEHDDQVDQATIALDELFDFLQVHQFADEEGKLIRYLRIHRTDMFRKLAKLGLVPAS